MTLLTVMLTTAQAAALLAELVTPGADIERPNHFHDLTGAQRALVVALEVWANAEAKPQLVDKPKRGRPPGARNRKPRPVQVQMPGPLAPEGKATP